MRRSVFTILVVLVVVVNMCSILSKRAKTSISRNSNVNSKCKNVLVPILVGLAIIPQLDPRVGVIAVVVVVIVQSIRVPVLRLAGIITRIVVMDTILIIARRMRRKINLV